MGARDPPHDGLPAAGRHDVLVAEDREHGVGPALKNLPCLVIGGVHGIVESGRQQLGEGPTSDGQRLVRVRRSVPLHNVRRRLDHGHQRKQAPWFPHRRIACHFLELGVRAFDLDLFGKRLCRVPVGQGGVGDHHSIGQAGILRSKTHADNASPIMHDKVDVDEPQFVDE